MTEDSTHTVYVDRITFSTPNDPRPVLGVVQDGWEWVELPKPSIRERLVAWWQGKQLQTAASAQRRLTRTRIGGRHSGQI